jgi:hypothetical protein
MDATGLLPRATDEGTRTGKGDLPGGTGPDPIRGLPER